MDWYELISGLGFPYAYTIVMIFIVAGLVNDFLSIFENA